MPLLLGEPWLVSFPSNFKQLHARVRLWIIVDGTALVKNTLETRIKIWYEATVSIFSVYKCNVDFQMKSKFYSWRCKLDSKSGWKAYEIRFGLLSIHNYYICLTIHYYFYNIHSTVVSKYKHKKIGVILKTQRCLGFFTTLVFHCFNRRFRFLKHVIRYSFRLVIYVKKFLI